MGPIWALFVDLVADHYGWSVLNMKIYFLWLIWTLMDLTNFPSFLFFAFFPVLVCLTWRVSLLSLASHDVFPCLPHLTSFPLFHGHTWRVSFLASHDEFPCLPHLINFAPFLGLTWRVFLHSLAIPDEFFLFPRLHLANVPSFYRSNRRVCLLALALPEASLLSLTPPDDFPSALGPTRRVSLLPL